MSEPLLRASGLGVHFGGPDVVHDINLDLTPGAAPVGIIGPSGAGKSTIAHALLGLAKPARGHVTFAGRTVAKLSRRDKKQFQVLVGSVSQDGLVGIEPRWTVDRAISGALTVGRKAGRVNGRSVDDLLTDVALTGRHARRVVGTLSGGEKQRLALAIALATRPQVLILDEPLTAVDPAMRGELVGRVSDLVAQHQIALLLISHDLEVVGRLCPTVHVLIDGSFAETGMLSDVLATATHPSVRELAAAAPLAVQRFR